jgi:hypothetical protein
MTSTNPPPPTTPPAGSPPTPTNTPPGGRQPPPLGPLLESALARFDRAIEDLAKAAELLAVETSELAPQLRAAGRVTLAEQARAVSADLHKAGGAVRATRRLLGVSSGG